MSWGFWLSKQQTEATTQWTLGNSGGIEEMNCRSSIVRWLLDNISYLWVVCSSCPKYELAAGGFQIYQKEKYTMLLVQIYSMLKFKKRIPLVVRGGGHGNRVWRNVSSLAVICFGNQWSREDAAWLKLGMHINLDELDMVGQCIDLAIKWNLVHIIVMMNSAIMRRWLKSALTDDQCIETCVLIEIFFLEAAFWQSW